MLGENVSFILRTFSTVIFARLLLPEHFGLVAMVTALTTIADRFKDFGLDLATVQRKHVTHGQVSTLFWINTGFGLFIMIAIASLSPLIAKFYKDPRLIPITLAISLGFLFGGITIQPQAILRRQMRFAALARINIAATGLSILLGIIIAILGYGYWALVWRQVAQQMILAGGTLFAARWVPCRPARGEGTRSMLRFGWHIFNFNIVYFFTTGLDQILIGKFWGAKPLGLYRQAIQLVVVPVDQIRYPLNSVAVPALSTLQTEPQRYRELYMKILGLLGFISIPIATYFVLFSESIVHVLLGSRWHAAIPIFRVLAIAAVIRPLADTCGFVMVTSGKSRRYFWWGVMNAICVVTGYLIGIQRGAIGVAIGFTIANYVALVPAIMYGFHDTPVTAGDFIRSIRLPFLSASLAALSLLISFHYIPWLKTVPAMPVSIILSAGLYMGLLFLMPGGKGTVIKYITYALSIFKKRPTNSR